MAKAAVPEGRVPDAELATLTGDRSVRRTYELVTRQGGIIGPLDGVRGASIHQQSGTTIQRGGQMALTDMGGDIDWLNARIRCGYQIEGLGDAGKWGLGVYRPAKPVSQHGGGAKRWDAQLLDVLTVVGGSNPPLGYALGAGANVTNAVKALVADVGEGVAAITDSDATLTTSRVWDAGTSYLTIINELLGSIGYWPLTTDADGNLSSGPYVRPQDRPVSFRFIDGETAIYRPEFTVEHDYFNIPNHVQAVAEGTGDVPTLVANVYNDDPESPYSTVNAPPNTHLIENVEATGQAAIDSIALRTLETLTEPTRTIVIAALPVPVSVNEVVEFRNGPAEVEGLYTVARIEYGAADTDLAAYTLRAVTDLG